MGNCFGILVRKIPTIPTLPNGLRDAISKSPLGPAHTKSKSTSFICSLFRYWPVAEHGPEFILHSHIPPQPLRVPGQANMQVHLRRVLFNVVHCRTPIAGRSSAHRHHGSTQTAKGRAKSQSLSHAKAPLLREQTQTCDRETRGLRVLCKNCGAFHTTTRLLFFQGTCTTSSHVYEIYPAPDLRLPAHGHRTRCQYVDGSRTRANGMDVSMWCQVLVSWL